MMKMLSRLSNGVIVSMAALSMLAMPVMAESFNGTSEGSHDVPVTVTFNEADDTIAAKAMIPTKIDIEGKTGTYHVIAYYEASEANKLNATLTIKPNDTFTLTETSGKTAQATVSQSKVNFTASDVQNGKDSTVDKTVTTNTGTTTTKVATKEVMEEGTITANGITVGTWTGNLTFTISAHK